MESCATKLIEFSRCLDELFNKMRWNKVETHTNVVSIDKKKLMRVSKHKIRHTSKWLHSVDKKMEFKRHKYLPFFSSSKILMCCFEVSVQLVPKSYSLLQLFN